MPDIAPYPGVVVSHPMVETYNDIVTIHREDVA
jgi:hypothetical protein